jgi:hypothetical protein
VAEKDYYSFEEVLRNLELEEDDLKRLVSAGEIRAFRDKDTMRFKAEDIERLRSDQGKDIELDDLDLDLDDDLELDVEPAGAEHDVLLLDEDEAGDDELVLETASSGDVEELDLGGEAAEEPAGGRGRARGGRAKAGGTAAAGRRPARAAAPEAEGSEGAGMLAALVIGIVILIFANFVVFDAVVGHGTNPLSKAVAGLFG